MDCRRLLIWAAASCLITLIAASVPAQDKTKTAQPPGATSTQNPAVTSASAPVAKPSDYSKEALVYDKLITRFLEESDGTGTRQTTARIRILADAGVKDMAVLVFTYTASNQQVDIAYVRVIKPDGSIVTTPDYNIQDMPADVTREAPMYSDIHQKHVAVKGLGVGDTLEYEYSLRTLKADVPGEFWLEYTFEKNLIVLDEQLDIDLPAEKTVTVASADIQPTVTTSGGRKLYHWASSNLARPDPDAPPKSTKNWKPSVQVTTFSSWEQVGAWYNSLQKDSLAVTPAIQAKAAALTKGLTSDEDKVRAIFNDVALHIHYVGLDFGLGRYQPHAADDVLSNEYGDCKDKHTLLAALLKAAGFEAWPVLISSSRELDMATPSPEQFDHVITLVPLSGKLLWMDSTAEIAPIGVLFGNLRDKQALAIPVGKPAYLEHTPPDLPFAQLTRFEARGTLSDQGVFTGHFVETFLGDGELIMRISFRAVPQSQWQQFLQNFSNALGFAGEVKNPQVSPIEQTSQPLQFSFDYTREKFGEWDSRRISPPMPPVGMELPPGVKQIKPADDIDLGSPGLLEYSSSVQIPSGWTVFPAQSTDVSEDWAEYHAKYAIKDGAFTADRQLLIKRDKVPLDQWEKYLAFRRAIYDDEVRMVPIMNPGTPSAGTDSTTIDLGSISAARREMFEALLPLRDVLTALMADPPESADQLSKTAETARDTLHEVETKSASLPAGDAHSLYWAQALAIAWCMRGWTALATDDLPAAENYVRAAWRLGQDPVSGYLMGRVLEAKGSKTAAAHQYELAHVTGATSLLGGISPQDAEIRQRIADSYQRLTGKPLTATALNHGAYSGSLQAELDNTLETHQFLHSTKLSGQGLYVVAFEAGKPATASFLGGDKGFAALVPALQAHSFPDELPAGSKARLLREVRIVCSPWSGCDSYLVLPGSIQLPAVAMPIHVIEVAPPNAPTGTKTVKIKQSAQ